jgi:hypothetical protein
MENLPPTLESGIFKLADAVNQLAIIVETLTWEASHTDRSGAFFGDIQPRLHKIREDIAELIPD